jgi:hypothetical protein
LLLQRIGDPANSKLIAKGPDSKGEARKWQIKTGAADHVSAMESILGFLKAGSSSGLGQPSSEMFANTSLHSARKVIQTFSQTQCVVIIIIASRRDEAAWLM